MNGSSGPNTRAVSGSNLVKSEKPERLPRTREFGNGRLVRKIFEAATARQATPVVTSGGSDLTSLTADDLGLAT